MIRVDRHRDWGNSISTMTNKHLAMIGSVRDRALL
jgi:hypothetical protein